MNRVPRMGMALGLGVVFAAGGVRPQGREAGRPAASARRWW